MNSLHSPDCPRSQIYPNKFLGSQICWGSDIYAICLRTYITNLCFAALTYVLRTYLSVILTFFHAYIQKISTKGGILQTHIPRLYIVEYPIYNVKTPVTTDILKKITEIMVNFWQKYGKNMVENRPCGKKYGKKYCKIW